MGFEALFKTTRLSLIKLKRSFFQFFSTSSQMELSIFKGAIHYFKSIDNDAELA